jgi:hypothetical protein
LGGYGLSLLVGWGFGADYIARTGEPVFWLLEAPFVALWAFLGLRQKLLPSELFIRARSARVIWPAVTFFYYLGLCWYGGIDLTVRAHLTGALLCAAGLAYGCWLTPIWNSSLDSLNKA